MNILKFLIVANFVFVGLTAFGRNMEYKSISGATVNIVTVDEKKDTYLIYYRETGTKWDKIPKMVYREGGVNIKYATRTATGNRRRPFDYYNTIVDGKRKTFVNGSIVPFIQVYIPDSKIKGEQFAQTPPTITEAEVKKQYKKLQ